VVCSLGAVSVNYRKGALVVNGHHTLVVDVVDNYFVIDYESPIRAFTRESTSGQASTTYSEGRLETKPVIAASVLEPWRRTSVGAQKRWEATFQTIRRRAVVRIAPDPEGYLIHLAVYNEIEDVPQALGSTTRVNLEYTDDLTQLEQFRAGRVCSDGWIDIGRDPELETRILQEIAWRLGSPPDVVRERTALTP
ncbi:MAG: hypothetical protein HUK22_07190, partial [Thermoguttaceae bacterium]|nr:hypothetical protein [Thermoguttaceae bacterium]